MKIGAFARSAARDDEIGRAIEELTGWIAARNVDAPRLGILDQRGAIDVAGVELADAAVI